MKKTFQRIDITAVAGETTTAIAQLRQDYSLCTGVFIVKRGEYLISSLQLKIAGSEILPSGFDAQLIEFNQNYALKDSVYDFAKENIPARSSEVDIQVTNTTSAPETFSIYFILENK